MFSVKYKEQDVNKNNLSSNILRVAVVLLLVTVSVAGCSDQTEAQTTAEAVYQGMYSYDDFDTPSTCGSCHQDIYSDWSNSLMGTNYLKQWKQVE